MRCPTARSHNHFSLLCCCCFQINYTLSNQWVMFSSMCVGVCVHVSLKWIESSWIERTNNSLIMKILEICGTLCVSFQWLKKYVGKAIFFGCCCCCWAWDAPPGNFIDFPSLPDTLLYLYKKAVCKNHEIEHFFSLFLYIE